MSSGLLVRALIAIGVTVVFFIACERFISGRRRTKEQQGPGPDQPGTGA